VTTASNQRLHKLDKRTGIDVYKNPSPMEKFSIVNELLRILATPLLNLEITVKVIIVPTATRVKADRDRRD
jgi:hypothetical protein